MFQVQGITDAPQQNFNIRLEDNSLLSLSLKYVDSQNSWFYAISHPKLTLNYARLTSTFSLLYQWQNIINFDISVSSTDIYDPAFQTDFTTGRIEIYVLTQDDRIYLDSLITGQIANGT